MTAIKPFRTAGNAATLNFAAMLRFAGQRKDWFLIMELSKIVFVQVLIVFILMAVGFILAKTEKLDEKGIKQLTDILLNIVTPCVLINAFQKEFDTQLLKNLGYAAFFSFVIIALSIVLCTVIFKKEPTLKYRVSIFGSVYSNCGFMAIPLLSAAMGEMGVFYGSAYLAVFTLLYWSHGIAMYAGSMSEISVKKIITNPGIIGTVIALLLFLFKITLPYPAGQAVSYLAAVNTPVAMIVMGYYIANVNIKSALKNKSVYFVTAMRLLIIPVITVLIAKMLKMDAVAAKSILISSSCPTAAVTTLLATRYKLDAGYASEVVALTTLLSVVTIPAILLLY